MSAESDERETKLTLPGGAELTAPTESIVALQPLGGRVAYLSDLKPSGYRHIPFLDLSWPYRTDHSVRGSLLRAGGKLYPKGLGMHSASRITYDLDQPFDRFDTEVALDSETGRRGSVVFRRRRRQRIVADASQVGDRSRGPAADAPFGRSDRSAQNQPVGRFR